MDKLDKKIESKINQNKNVPLKFTQTIQGALYKETKTKNKILHINKETHNPTQMEIKDNKQKTTIYILYNEVKVNSTQ